MSPRWSYWLLKFLQFQCIMLGFTTLIIDFKKRHLIQYKYIKIYETIMSLVSLFLLINSFYWTIFIKPSLADNLVITFTLQSEFCVRSVLTVMIILMRTKRDNGIKKLLNNIFDLQTTCFGHFNEKLVFKEDLRKIWFKNITLMVPHIINLYLYFWSSIPRSDPSKRIEIYYVCSQISLTHLILLHHSAILCYMHKCFLLLNYQLEHRVEVNNLSYIYFRLCSWMQQLNVIYSPILICIQIHFLLALTIVVLSIGEVLVYPGKYREPFTLYSSLIFYIILCIHMFGYLFICDRIQRTSGSIQKILLLYNQETYNEEVSFFLFSNKIKY